MGGHPSFWSHSRAAVIDLIGHVSKFMKNGQRESFDHEARLVEKISYFALPWRHSGE